MHVIARKPFLPALALVLSVTVFINPWFLISNAKKGQAVAATVRYWQIAGHPEEREPENSDEAHLLNASRDDRVYVRGRKPIRYAIRKWPASWFATRAPYVPFTTRPTESTSSASNPPPYATWVARQSFELLSHLRARFMQAQHRSI